MSLYLSCSHNSCIERYDFLIEAFKLTNHLWNESRFKLSISISWNIYCNSMTFLVYQSLFIATITAVIIFLLIFGMFWISNMRLHLLFKHLTDKLFFEDLKETIFAKDL
jgi:hypothetical protein